MANPLRKTYPGAFYHVTIHLNPVRAKMVETPEDYDWSSYKFHIGRQRSAKWLYRDFILGCFGKKVSIAQKRYQEFVNALTDQEYNSPLEIKGNMISIALKIMQVQEV